MKKIKTIAEVDYWRRQNKTIEGDVMSRYSALKVLFGEAKADKIMRNLEIELARMK